MRLLILAALVLFVLAALFGFGVLGGASLSVILGLIAAGLAAYMAAIASP